MFILSMIARAMVLAAERMDAAVMKRRMMAVAQTKSKFLIAKV
jgi:hypothetical protein